jgi:hypothetical protein
MERMDYVDFLWLKLGALALLVFVLGCFNLLPKEGPPDEPPPPGP